MFANNFATQCNSPFEDRICVVVANVKLITRKTPNNLTNCLFLRFQRAAAEGHNRRTVHPTIINEDELAIVRLSVAEIIIIRHRHRRNATVIYRIIVIRVKESPKRTI